MASASMRGSGKVRGLWSQHPCNPGPSLSRLGWTLTWLFLFSLPAFPHAGNVSYSQFTVQDREVRVEIQILVKELLLAVPLDGNQDGAVDPRELEASRELLTGYLREKLEIFSVAKRLPLRVESFEVRLRAVVDSEPLPFLFAQLVFESPRPLTQFRIRCHLLDEVDIRHDNFAKIDLHGFIRPFVFTPSNAFVYRGGKGQSVQVASSAWGTFYSFGVLGVEHIFTGYDHMLFLIGLVLVATAFAPTVKVVTAFTIAHSVSLALAALRVVQVPSSLVEAVIALSIMYVACENFFSWFPVKRWIISFGFGLVHGLAFAQALEILHLPRIQFVTALFSFNVGIEIAQVVIVALIFPFILAMAKAPWRLRAVQGFSFLIFWCGTLWLAQRTFW